MLLAGVCLFFAAAAAHPQGQIAKLDFTKVGLYGVDKDFLDLAIFKFLPEKLPDYYSRRVDRAKDRGQTVIIGLYTWDRINHKKPLAQVFADTDAILDSIDLAKVDIIYLSEEEVTWNNGVSYLNSIYDHVKRKFPGPIYQWYSNPLKPNAGQKADGWILDAYGMRYEKFKSHIQGFTRTKKPLLVCINATPGVTSLESSKEQVKVCEELNLPVFFFGVAGPNKGVEAWLDSEEPAVTEWRKWFFETLDYCHGIRDVP